LSGIVLEHHHQHQRSISIGIGMASASTSIDAWERALGWSYAFDFTGIRLLLHRGLFLFLDMYCIDCIK
jgi:hypothetical protein